MKVSKVLLWQEKFPDEVKALVGLDWALPSSYEDLKENQTLLLWRIGAVRLAYYATFLSPYI